jgi:MoxR-like ATPase
MFSSPEDVQGRFEEQDYLCSRDVATVVYVALKLEKPLLVEGPAGVGKTDLAKVLAVSQGLELIRLQCYEGLDETKALYEWEYAKQLLYTQILKEKIGLELASCKSLREAVERIADQEDAFFSSRFILPRPLLKAIRSREPTVLLIDEVDKADPEFEAFLLEVLSDFQVSVPEIGTLKATHIPQVVLTSNASREISDGLKRRCVHLFMDFPDPEQEARIVARKIPGIGDTLVRQIVRVVAAIRRLDLKKPPSISETLDWARSLLILNAELLDTETLRTTLNTLVKYQSDIEKVSKELPHLVA